MARKYNFVYNQLVRGEDDLIGQVAYALYKQDKGERIDLFKQDHGREPEEEELHEIHKTMCSPKQLDLYQTKAAMIIQNTLSHAMQERIKKIEEDLAKKQKIHLESIVASLKSSAWSTIGLNIVASFIFAGLLTFIALIIKYYGTGLNITFN